MLSIFMEVCQHSNIDYSGYMGTLAKDGSEFYGIVLRTFGVDLPPRPRLLRDYRTWTAEQHAANDERYEQEPPARGTAAGEGCL